jgi:hypothetical protein
MSFPTKNSGNKDILHSSSSGNIYIFLVEKILYDVQDISRFRLRLFFALLMMTNDVDIRRVMRPVTRDRPFTSLLERYTGRQRDYGIKIIQHQINTEKIDGRPWKKGYSLFICY